jgi:DNA excision repair protein ERCC-5
MGVDQLWRLVAPSGKRIAISRLATRRLAVDVSIWLTQFVKAMRDADGNVQQNAHLLGMFRRVCRLLFHRIRPVFVFDGPAPSLKRRTIVQRRRHRAANGSSAQRTAERILLSQLKVKSLEALRTRAGAARSASAASTAEGEAGAAAEAEGNASASQASATEESSGEEQRRAGEEDEESEDEGAEGAGEDTGKGSVPRRERGSASSPLVVDGDGDADAAAARGGKAEGPEAKQRAESASSDEESEVRPSDDEFDIDVSALARGSELAGLDEETIARLPRRLRYEVFLFQREEQARESIGRFQRLSSQPEQISSMQVARFLANSQRNKRIREVRVRQAQRARGLGEAPHTRRLRGAISSCARR